MRIRGRARTLLRLAVTAGVVAFLLTRIPPGDLGGALRGVRPSWLALGALLYLAGQLISAGRWSLIGRAVGLLVPPSRYVRFYVIGMFFNLFGPSTVGGDAVRGLYLGAGGRRALALNTVVFDRMAGLAVLMAVGGIAVLLFPGYGLPGPLVATAVGTGAVLFLGWWLCPTVVRLLPERHRVRRHVERDLAPFWRDHRLHARVVLLSLAVHALQVVVQYTLIRAVGATVPLSYCLVFHPLLSAITAVPVSIAGIGIRESAYLYFLGRVGVEPAVAVSVGILWLGTAVVSGLLGAAVFLATGAELPRLREPRARDAA